MSLDRVRIIHLATYGGPYAGSFIPAIRALGRAADERDWSFEIIFSPAARGREWLPELEDEHIRVSFAPRKSWPDGLVWLTRRLREDTTPTVLHSHFSGYDLLAVGAAALSWQRPAIFWHVHSGIRTERIPRARNIVKYAVLGRGISQFLCVSPDIADAVRNRGARRDRVCLFPNAIDLGRFPPATLDDRARARRELGIPVQSRVLLHFGWDWRRKGGDVLLHAVRALRDSGVESDMLVVTVGGGADAREMVTTLGLDSIVRVLDARSDVWTLYAAADVFVCPSRAEGMPFSMIEALATGMNVVASDIPGQALIGRDLAACRLVGPDVDELASALFDQLSQKEHNSPDVVQTTRQLLGERVDLQAWARRVLSLYVEALDPVHAGGGTHAP